MKIMKITKNNENEDDMEIIKIDNEVKNISG